MVSTYTEDCTSCEAQDNTLTQGCCFMSKAKVEKSSFSQAQNYVMHETLLQNATSLGHIVFKKTFLFNIDMLLAVYASFYK